MITLRRQFILAAPLLIAAPAAALVQGSAPPPPKSKRELPKCRSLEECEEIGARRQQDMDAASDEALPFFTTASGVRWRDVSTGSGMAVKKGSAVEIRYRVMKLGKRSKDGLSGEATPVFSFGYGEDDDVAGAVVTAEVGNGQLIQVCCCERVWISKGRCNGHRL